MGGFETWSERPTERHGIGRVAFEAYNRLGYVPNNIGVGQNVARTLEYAS